MKRLFLPSHALSFFKSPKASINPLMLSVLRSLLGQRRMYRRMSGGKIAVIIKLLLFSMASCRARSVPIRVLLKTVSPSSSSLCKAHTYTSESEEGFITQTHIGSAVKAKSNETFADVMVSNGNLYVFSPTTYTKKVRGKSFTITGKDNHLYLEGKPYTGSITFLLTENNTLQIINTLDLEDYIYSVIPLESFQSWPTEMHKVQAVVSRTYALHHIFNARKRNKSYDIQNRNFHQTYDGHHSFHHIRDAVDATKNLIISHTDNKPILAMFDGCCGGIVPAYMKDLDFKKAPYLARKKRCTHCKNYSLYRWSCDIPLADVEHRLRRHSALKKNMATIGILKDVCILEKDKAGVIHRVHIKGSRKNFICSGKKLRDSMKGKMWSQSFSLRKHGSTLRISGNGFGHQTGLCQRGAYALHKNNGWDFKKILHFYYPGTQFSFLKRRNSRKA